MAGNAPLLHAEPTHQLDLIAMYTFGGHPDGTSHMPALIM